ncbi:replication protein C [uncultured Methanocorpusculum sp.]|nr:replication protein C [uncultured Methanocorpusculum sp.]
MLWIEKYRPHSFEEVIGQTSPVKQLSAYAALGNLPHLLVIGRSGCGKSSALEVFSRQFYPESAAENTTVLPVSVMFSQGHTYFAENDRFAHLYQKNKSVLANFKYIVRWHASLKPLSAPFRLIIFDGAGDLTKDAQAALRRIMEQYSQTCRFIFVTSSLASIIDPIRSRCVPLYFLPIDEATMRPYLKHVLEQEGCAGSVSDENLDMLILGSAGDLRKALVWLELMALHDVSDLSELMTTETGELSAAAVLAAGRSDFSTAQKIVENLQIEYGMNAGDVLRSLRSCLIGNITPELALLFSKAEITLVEGQNEYLQMNVFVAELTELLSAPCA